MITKCSKRNYFAITTAAKKTPQSAKCMASAYAECSGVQNCLNIEAGKFS